MIPPVHIGLGMIIAGAATWYYYTNGPWLPDTVADSATPDTGGNLAWSQYAYSSGQGLGYYPDEITRSLDKFNDGNRLNGEELSIMQSIMQHVGGPPTNPRLTAPRQYAGLQSSTGPTPSNPFREPASTQGATA